MTNTIVMIHGMFCSGWHWSNYEDFFKAKGYECIVPTLRYHDIDPKDQPNPRLGTTSLLDYAEDLEDFGLIACVNAGMFQTDYLSNVGYMKNFKHVNNKREASKFLSVFASNPVDSKKPPARIFDIDEQRMNDIIRNYNIVVQNLRLIKRPRQNRWSQQDKMWSEVALGEDKQGNILFIFSRSPYSMHDFNNILLQLPIDIACAQHLEGGPEASLYFSYKNIEIDEFGSYETAYKENDDSNRALELPNVIGIVKKTIQ